MHRRLTYLAALATCSTVLLGCSSSSEDSASGCTPTSRVSVTGNDALQFDQERYETTAGCVEFTYLNEGGIPHTLLIKNNDEFLLQIGESDEGTVELEPGQYTLYCNITGHEAGGMVAELVVT
ncbi:MAG: hypothetical protein EXQ71_09450 [Acidimicrobiia bacterium]|nr:hypothetical protein [Acidimicrobiia bacterium]